MVEPSARIRSYQPDDHKLARFFIGRANFEVLAVANRKGEVYVYVESYVLNSAYLSP